MATWAAFETAEPEMAARGRALFGPGDIAYLGTTSSSGRPRIHPFVPLILDGRLTAFIVDGSPKRFDLDRSGQYAIHASLGADDEQFLISGAAQRVEDEERRRAVSDAMPYDDADEHHLLYEFGIGRALWTTWVNPGGPDTRPLHRRWIEG
jgi:hypothetical protein